MQLADYYSEDYGIVGVWTKCVTSHHITCTSASDDDSQQMVDYWESLLSYLYYWHDNCYHLFLYSG